MASSLDCDGQHRFFVADVAAVHDEGTVSVIVVCTSCGLNQLTVHKIAEPSSQILTRKPLKEKEHE